jgi:hypothetical protein
MTRIRSELDRELRGAAAAAAHRNQVGDVVRENVTGVADGADEMSLHPGTLAPLDDPMTSEDLLRSRPFSRSAFEIRPTE